MKSLRFSLIGNLVVFVTSVGAGISAAADSPRPNVVFIMADDKYNDRTYLQDNRPWNAAQSAALASCNGRLRIAENRWELMAIAGKTTFCYSLSLASPKFLRLTLPHLNSFGGASILLSAGDWLKSTERQELQAMIRAGKAAARKLIRARVLAADQAEGGPAKSDPECSRTRSTHKLTRSTHKLTRSTCSRDNSTPTCIRSSRTP